MTDSAPDINNTNKTVDRRRQSLSDILDQTQGHLILRFNAWRRPGFLNEIGLPALYCLVALGFLVFFAIESFVHNETWHARLLLVFAMLTVCCFVYLRLTGNRRTTNTFIVVLLGTLCLFLLYTGGIGGTGPLWYFVFPLVALYLQKLWAGILSSLLLLLISAALLAYPPASFDPSIYSAVFLERFFAVYIAVSVMAALYAFVRTSAELNLEGINETFRNLANTDELTGLPNRRRMQAVLNQEVSRMRRSRGKFSLINFDLDHFKWINDEHWHECGDKVLRAIPGILQKVLRTQDICARWGGEEFLVLLPETALAGGRQVAERLRRAFEEHPFRHDEREFTVTASFGVSEFDHPDDLEDCLKRADMNVYQAKADGRNKVIASPAQ